VAWGFVWEVVAFVLAPGDLPNILEPPPSPLPLILDESTPPNRFDCV
jgi:hypothetical protein